MDETDVEILKVLMDSPNISASEIAHTMFLPKNDLVLRKKESFLRYRLAVLESFGLVKKVIEGKVNRYRVPLETMSMGTVRLTIDGCEEEVELGTCLYIPNGEYNRLILLE
jgi:repressor of nif and glnA expression